jgi:hypothetical protein
LYFCKYNISLYSTFSQSFNFSEESEKTEAFFLSPKEINSCLQKTKNHPSSSLKFSENENLSHTKFHFSKTWFLKIINLFILSQFLNIVQSFEKTNKDHLILIFQIKD